MNARTAAFFCVLILFAGGPLHADSIAENFLSRADFVSGSAIWNQELGAIHPTLAVTGYYISPQPDLNIDVGDGSDGAFDTSTYAQFSQNGDLSGNIIRFDTDAHPILKVTHFILAQGWLLIPVGSQPLIIESLGVVQIQGEIHCEGTAGGDASGATPGAGGQGHCGGLDGGSGGGPSLDGASGGDAGAPTVTGGQAGNTAGGVVGGGGGGGWSSTGAAAGSGASASGGSAGGNTSQPLFTTVAGGSGGGGGSGSATAGGGGGGGGGVVIIHSVGDIELGASPSSAFGYLYADGGNGGNAGVGGGPGGGGGGGSVQLWTGGNLSIFNTDPASSQANGGNGGTNPTPASGGNGGLGRSWGSAVNVNSNGSYSPPEELPVIQGLTMYSNTTEYVITRPFDTGGNFATVNSFALTPVSSDFQFELSGSSDDFVNDSTGWTTNAAAVSDKRYLQMRISITTSNQFNPTMVNLATIDYTPGGPSEFDFKSAGCGRIDDSPWGNGLFLLLAPFMLLCLRLRNQKSKPTAI